MTAGKNEDRFAAARQRMLEWDVAGRNITNAGVIRVMSELPREEFVPQAHKSQSYADNPLPIGMGQTISQPYIVALMTQELRVNVDCEVLEIGTGSGYQTAILCRLAKKVYTIERFSELSASAQETLGRLGIGNVEFHTGDGSCGWPGQRTFERIMITAAVPRLPEPVVEQLADGGIMVAPVGPVGVQQLMVCEKKAGVISRRVACDCRFVKLLGKYGFEES
jgi:protein-L-isoaspartate(D-aspartate) O-methyltransferase